MSVTVEVKVPQATEPGSVGAIALGFSPRIILKLIGLRLTSFVTRQFETHGDGKWAPLRASTLANRARGGAQPLQDTGRYRQSFVAESDQNTFVEVGTNDFRGKIHELGTKPYVIRARGRALAFKTAQGEVIFRKAVNHPGVPARPVLPTKAVAERLVQAELDSYLDTLAGA